MNIIPVLTELRLIIEVEANVVIPTLQARGIKTCIRKGSDMQSKT